MTEDRHVAVENLKLHIREGGVASSLPPVVLEAGCGSTLYVWAGVERELAAHTRVLSYERTGVGSSSGPVDSVSAAVVSQRLLELLDTNELREPAVVVGHSLGGLYMRYYTAMHPERVKALVLLDTTPEDLPFPRFFSWKPTILMWLVYAIALTGVPGWWYRRRHARQDSTLALETLKAISRSRHVRTVLRELRSLREIQAEVAALPPPTALPVLTISAGHPAPGTTPEQIKHFRSSHDELAEGGVPPYSRHVRIAGATHMSMLMDPQHAKTVAAHILDFIRQIAQSPRA